MKRPAPTTKKITPWREYCLWLWGIIIRLRARGRCEICGSTKRLQAHHLIDKEVLVYQYELMNGICLCYRCHRGDKHTAAHRNPKRFEQSAEIEAVCTRRACRPTGQRGTSEEIVYRNEGYDSPSILELLRINWWRLHYRTGPEHDALKPKLGHYPGIADFLEQEREKYDAK